MTRPIDVARKLCRNAKPSYLAAIENGDRLFRERGVDTPLRLSHFLAQAFHETGGLTIEWESGNYSAERLMEIFGVGHHSAAVTESEARQLAHNGPAIFERVYGLGNPKKAAELGNTQPGDGFKYRGGGILQTTGRANYRRMGQKCGVNFEGHPELVLSAEHALNPALAEWSEGNLNAAADRDDIVAITKKINGGLNGLADRKDWYRRIRPSILVVDLVDVPVTSAETKTVPQSGIVKHGTAGAIVVAGGAVAQQAHASGVGTTTVALIVIIAVVVGAIVWLAIHRRQNT